MERLYILTLVLITVFIYRPGVSQQIPVKNFYQVNPFSINPAAAGLQQNVAAFLNYRDQWSGLKGAPESFRFGVHGLITGTMGLGLNIEQNNSGVFKQFSTDLNYSYRIALGDNNRSLAFGLLFAFFQNKVNYERVVIGNETDPALYGSGLIDETMFRAGFGVHYNSKDLNVHFSAPVMYGTEEKEYLQNLYGLVTYDFYFSDEIWKLQPSVLYRYTAGNINRFDINIMTEWDSKMWCLAGYRTDKNILAGVGVFIKNIGIGYIYEINRSELSGVATGSHEIAVYFESPYSVTKKNPSYRSSKRRNAWN